MASIFQYGLPINLFFQGLGEWLKFPMLVFTFMGTELFYIVFISIIYWAFSTGLGARMALLLMISSSINSILKLVFHLPRPYWIDIKVRGFVAESSFGLPSGHSQNAVVIWGAMAAWIRRPWAWIVAIFLMLLIGLSRIYLGVHFPTDVLAGWIVGAIILVIYLALEPPVKRWLLRQSTLVQILTGFLGSILLIFLTLFVQSRLSGYVVPQDWITNSHDAFPGSDPLDPVKSIDPFSSAGVLFGLALGLAMLYRSGGMDTRGSWLQRLVRILIGLVGVGVFYYGLKLVLPGGGEILAQILRYLRYALVGMWVSWLAPLVFFALKLAKKSA